MVTGIPGYSLRFRGRTVGLEYSTGLGTAGLEYSICLLTCLLVMEIQGLQVGVW